MAIKKTLISEPQQQLYFLSPQSESRQQVITWANVDPNLFMELIGHSELIVFHIDANQPLRPIDTMNKDIYVTPNKQLIICHWQADNK